jgi:hypothetical protein
MAHHLQEPKLGVSVLYAGAEVGRRRLAASLTSAFGKGLERLLLRSWSRGCSALRRTTQRILQPGLCRELFAPPQGTHLRRGAFLGSAGERIATVFVVRVRGWTSSGGAWNVGVRHNIGPLDLFPWRPANSENGGMLRGVLSAAPHAACRDRLVFEHNSEHNSEHESMTVNQSANL